MARSAFRKARSDIYETLFDKLHDTGSRRIETMTELFDAWATREEGRKQEVALVYRAIAQKLKTGAPFSAAIKNFVPAEESLLLDAGEASGRLPEALKACLTSQKAHDEMRGAVTGALMQPAFGFLGLIGSSALMGSMLWPELLNNFKPKYWPTWALVLVEAQVWMASHWPFVATLGLFVALYYYTLPRFTGRYRRYLDMVPPWSVYRDRTASGLLIILAGLIRAGLQVDESLERIAKGSTPYMRWHLLLIKRRIKAHGSDAIKAFDTGLFSQAILDRIEDAGRSRDMADTISVIGERSLHMIVKDVKQSAAVANSLLMLIVGVLFAWSLAAQVIGTQSASEKFIAEMRH
jgi:type II secretory pathway component PulF